MRLFEIKCCVKETIAHRCAHIIDLPDRLVFVKPFAWQAGITSREAKPKARGVAR